MSGLGVFTIAYPRADSQFDQAADDLPYARALARWLGLQLHESELWPQAAELLPKLVRHLEQH